MMTLRMPLSIATSVPDLNCIICQAWRASAWPRGSITISLAPRLAACLKKVAATGWFSVGLAPITMMTSEFLHSLKVAVTAAEPTPSSSAATDEAWHSRVQWSTLLEPKPVRTSFWNRYASSFEPLAEPKPASARGPSRSRIFTRPLAARSIASSQVASRKCVHGFAGSTRSSAALPTPSLRTIGLVRRCGLLT